MNIYAYYALCFTLMLLPLANLPQKLFKEKDVANAMGICIALLYFGAYACAWLPTLRGAGITWAVALPISTFMCVAVKTVLQKELFLVGAFILSLPIITFLVLLEYWGEGIVPTIDQSISVVILLCVFSQKVFDSALDGIR